MIIVEIPVTGTTLFNIPVTLDIPTGTTGVTLTRNTAEYTLTIMDTPNEYFITCGIDSTSVPAGEYNYTFGGNKGLISVREGSEMPTEYSAETTTVEYGG